MANRPTQAARPTGCNNRLACGNAGAQPRFEQPLDERLSEHRSEIGSSGGNHFRVHDGDGQGGHGDHETDQRAGQRHIEKRSAVNDRRADADERAQRADQRGSGHKERIRRANVVVAAGEEMAELVRQQNAEQRAGERNARQEQPRLAKRPEISGIKFVERGSAPGRVGAAN